MKATRMMSFLLALIMVLGMLPAAAFATDSTPTAETTVAATASTDAAAETYDGNITGWQSYGGSTWMTYEADAMQITSKTNPGTVFFADRKFKNYEMEVELQLNSGPWFAVMYRGIGDEKGFFAVRPGEDGAHKLTHHISKESSGWQTDDVTSTAGASAYTTGTIMKVKLRMENNYISVYTKMSTDTDYIQEFDKVLIPEKLRGEGYVGIGMQIASVAVYSVSIQDLDSDYTYISDFASLASKEGRWVFEGGSGAPTVENGVIKPNITTFSTFYKYKNVNWKNYVLETEYSYTAQYAGIVFRGFGDYNGYYNIKSAGTSTQRGLNYWTHSSDEGTSLATITAGSPYTYGARIKLRVTVSDNKLTIEEKIDGVDTDWVKTVDNYSITDNAAHLGTAGTIGFYTRTGSNLSIYNLKVTDTDTGYCYNAIEPVGEWVLRGGSGAPTVENGVLKPNISSFSTFYTYENVDWENYVLETEYSYAAQYAGIVFRGFGDYNGYYNIKSAGTSTERGLNYWDFTPDAGTSLATITEGSPYTYGARIKLRVTVQDNKLTIEEQIVGVDTDWVKTVDNYSITDNAAHLGTAGTIGFYTRTGSKLSIYNLKVTDTDTGYCYKAIDPVGEWGFDRGSGSPEITDGVLMPNITTTQTVYMYQHAYWDNYVLETELSYTAQYAGLIFRSYNNHYGYYAIKGAGTSTTRPVSWFKNSGSASSTSITTAKGSNYVYGNRVKIRVTVQDNKLKVEEKIDGVDTDWVTTLDNVNISDYSVLGTGGTVGLYSRSGSKMKVYAFKVTDTDTGFTYDLFQETPVVNTDSVAFDGNHVIDTSAPLTKAPDTVELWFKTSNKTEQALLSNAWNGYQPNEMYLTISAAGKLSYFEDNPDSQMGENVDIQLVSSAGFNDGNWHKVVIRRYYDEARELFKVDLSAYTDGELVDRSTQTNVIGDTKKEQYTENGNEFVSNRILQIGTKNDNRYVFVGEMGEIRMWDHALSDEEAASERIALKGTEEGLLHCFVPENGTNFVDLVTSKTANEITADMAELWMENYVIGDADWRIAVLPDVQHNTEAYEIQLRNYFAWLRDNAEAYNIKLIISVGDMVNTCTPEQMHIVSEASSVLDGVVPFMPLMGNHDYPNYERDYMLWNEYFPYAKYSQYDYFGGAFEEGRMDNYYYLMNIHGEDYLFMGLELAVRPAVAQWANEVIAAHPDHKVIIVNHDYLSVDSEIVPGGRSDSNGRFKNDGMEATELYDCLISQQDNILLVISGHVHHYLTGRRTDVTASGHIVNALGFDTAQIERYYGTVGMVDFLGFTDGSNTVQVNSYSTERGQFFKSTDQFTIELDWDKAYPGKPAESEIVTDGTMAQKIADAKTALYSGNANAYVQIANAGSVTSVVTDKTYASDAKLNVFGESVSAWYAEGGNVYVHILALGAAETVTLKGDADVIIQTNAFASGELEVVTPADLNDSRYDYLLHQWNATISGAGKLGLTSAKAVGENTIVYFDGAYSMVSVSQMLSRSVAAINVAGENWSGEIALIEGDTLSTGTLNITCQGTIAVDGDLSDWNENILATGRTMTGIGDTAHKNVTFYAYMAEEGLYVAAKANHSTYIDNASNWYDNTNLEFYLNGESVRLWLTANPECKHENVQDAFKTQLNGKVYTTVAEGFIAVEDLPENARSGELQIGFAWKTPGDKIKYYNMTGGSDWWYLTRRHASKILEQYFVNASGIGLYSNVRPVNEIQLDGDFSDFNAESLNNKLSITSQDGTVGFDTVAQYVPGYGVYVGVKAKSKTNPRPDGSDSWSLNTNLEFYVGANRYYITNRGAAVGNGLYAKNVHWDQTHYADAGLYYTTMEFFIPASALGTVNNEDYLRMGFAFKPTGESVLLNGHTEATDYWHMYGRGPSDTANQFYIYDSGIYLTEQTNKVVSQQVSLGEDLTMNFVVDAYQGTTVNITIAGETTSYDLSQMTADENGQYTVSAQLAAAQMTENINVQFVKYGSVTLEKNYSIRDYAEAILNGEYQNKEKNLAKWMLNYGAKAQQYFGVNLDKLANEGYEITENAALPTEYEEMSKEGSISGLKFYGASLVFESKIAIRFYFTGSIDGVSFGDYTAVPKNDMFYVEVSGINPQDYSKSIVITATKGEESLTVSYSPLNYIIRMSENGSDSLKPLLNAMYGYHEAALHFVEDEVFFGTSGTLITTDHFNLNNDTGSYIGTTTVDENGIAFGYVDGFSEESFYTESKFHINSILETEAYPKFGLIVEAGNIREYFYVDMATDLTATAVGRMTNTNNTDDWKNIQVATVNGMAFAGQDETLTLGVLKNGADMHLFVNGAYILTHTSSISGAAATGVFGFNTGMTLSKYYTDTAINTLNAKLALVNGASMTTNYFTPSTDGKYMLSTNENTDIMVDSVSVAGEVVRAENYSIKGTLSLSDAEKWGQARILVTDDTANSYVIALEKTSDTAYQIIAMSKLNETNWNDWRLISHSGVNKNRNSIDFELVVNEGKICFLIDDMIYFENSRVAMTASTPGFSACNVATSAVSNLSVHVFADSTETQNYIATKTYVPHVTRHQSSFDAFEQSYLIDKNCVGNGGTLILGDSYMDFWTTWESQLGLVDGVTGYNVGIGGETTKDWILNYDKLIKPFAADRILINIGFNDVNSYGDNGEDVAKNLRTLFEKIHTDYPETQIYYIFINPCPHAYADGAYKNWKIEDAINRSKELVAELDYVTGIDVFDLMTTEDGQNPVASYYTSDNIHLTAAGYSALGAYLYDIIFKDNTASSAA